MNQRIRRLVTTAALAVLTVAGTVGLAAPADATSVLVPGCYGAADTIYCDITVKVELPLGVDTTNSTVPVCVVICVDVPVTAPVVTLDNPNGGICVTANDRNGNQNFNKCLDVAVVVGSCGDSLGYRITIVDATLLGCEAFVPGLPRIVLCAGQGGFYYFDEVTHIQIGDGCLS